MASSNAVTLFASVIFGITVFGEKLSNGSNRLAPAFIGLAVALAGVVLSGWDEAASSIRATSLWNPDIATRFTPLRLTSAFSSSGNNRL